MTNEEMQKTMEFILEHQAQFAVNIQRLQEERSRDHPRLARLEESFHRLEESFQTLVLLAQTSDSRLDTLESSAVTNQQRVTRLEESFQLLVQIAQTSDSRLDTLESSAVTDQQRVTRLEESFQLLVQIAQNTDSRFDGVESNLGTLESTMAALAAAQANSEERLSALIDIVREQRNGKS
jgi:chromosome segregation ATPase